MGTTFSYHLEFVNDYNNQYQTVLNFFKEKKKQKNFHLNNHNLFAIIDMTQTINEIKPILACTFKTFFFKLTHKKQTRQTKTKQKQLLS